jgi:hypothetical protein
VFRGGELGRCQDTLHGKGGNRLVTLHIQNDTMTALIKNCVPEPQTKSLLTAKNAESGGAGGAEKGKGRAYVPPFCEKFA